MVLLVQPRPDEARRGVQHPHLPQKRVAENESTLEGRVARRVGVAQPPTEGYHCHNNRGKKRGGFVGRPRFLEEQELDAVEQTSECNHATMAFEF